MAPEVTIEPPGPPKQITVIRANPAQTATLKKAFAISAVVSREQQKALSEETGLPEKWIHLWFGRQRAKERKSKSKAVAPASGSAPDSNPFGSVSASADIPASSSGLDAPLSAQEILRVKLENHDPTSISSLDSLPYSLPLPDWSSPGAPSGSEYMPASISASSSAILAPLPPAAPVAPAEPARKKRGRIPRNENQNQNQDQNQNQNPNPNQDQTTRTVRARRAKGKKRNAVIGVPQSSLVKKELIEASAKLRYSPQPADGVDAPAFCQGVSPAGLTLTQAPANMITGYGVAAQPTYAPRHYTQPLSAINPAKRSLLATATSRSGSLRQPTNNFDCIDLHLLPTSSGALGGGGLQQDSDVQHNAAAPTLPSRSQRPALPLYRQGPIFKTRFHNNGPSNYSPEILSNAPSGSVHNTASFPGPVSDNTSIFSALDTIPPMRQEPFSGHYVSRPLGPVFDWENHIPSEPSFGSSGSRYDVPQSNYQYIQPNLSVPAYQPQNQHIGYLNHEATVYHEAVELFIPHQQPGGTPLLAQGLLSHSDSFDDFLQGTVLDPSIAPLKHLTDVLQNFKDEHGTFLPLMSEQERGNLMKCLLDERLAERNPFQAAMGLSLLSKLGVEWEM